MSPESGRKRLQARIFGLVQGVSFRYYTRREAQRLGLTGWVRNLADGSVELVAEGAPGALDEFLAWCRHGPEPAEVQKVDAALNGATGEYLDFSVRR